MNKSIYHTITIMLGCLFVATSCNSPADIGHMMATKEIELYNRINDYQVKALTELYNNFESYNFSSRDEAYAKINDIEDRAHEAYNTAKEGLYEEFAPQINDFQNDSQKLSLFLQAYKNTISSANVRRVDSQEWREKLQEKVNQIIGDPPTANQISSEIIGKEIQGLPGTILANYKIKVNHAETNIIDVADLDNRTKKYVVEMNVSESVGNYKVEAEIIYRLDQSGVWNIDMINTTSFDIVKTGDYDKCVYFSIEGLPSERALVIENRADVELVVGGYITNEQNTQTKPFCVILKPFEKKSISCWFLFSVGSYSIVYIERV